MKTAIIIHGRPDKEEYFDGTLPKPTEAHWLPWLKRSLEARGYQAYIPEMPRPYEPRYEDWQEVLETYPIDQDTVLVGHSRGGAFLLRWLSEHDVRVGKVMLVAPSITPNYPVEVGFSEFTIDPRLTHKVGRVVMFYSTDDEGGILESVKKVKDALPEIVVKEFTTKGHFTSEDGVSEFPELLEEILK